MNKFLYDSINKYFKTLAYVGNISKVDKYALFVVSTLYSMYNAFGKLFDKEGVEKLNKYVKCLTSNKCIFNKSIPCFTYGSDQTFNSLITIIDNDVITTTSGNVMVSTTGKTQTFTDFSVRTDIQPDQFLVGYDRSDNNEMAVNVNDLGLFWEIDI